MANYIVWGLFIFALCFLGFSLKRVDENRVHRQKLRWNMKLKERYSYLRPES